ncbi:MAG: hypothetical protein OXR82_09270 [Gammaproteobacteria bacterium]|nr:hypothetical protein [Gammaproteobacteria bacterium]
MEWDEGFDIRNTPSELFATRLQQAIDVLGLMGVRVKRSSRPHEALRHLKTFQNDGAFDPKIDAAKRLAEEFVLIVSAAYRCRRLGTPFSLDKMQRMLDDPLVPSGQQSPGRDVQFELLLAAMFHLGGAEVVTGEPDLRITYREETIGVAAKRITSLNSSTLSTRVREAVRQINGSRLRGWIALNLDTRFESLQRVDDEVLLRVASEEFDAVRREVGDKRWDRECVMGLILHGRAAEWTPRRGGEAPRYKLAWFQRWLLLVDDAATEPAIRDFGDSLFGAMESSVREIWREDYTWRM